MPAQQESSDHDDHDHGDQKINNTVFGKILELDSDGSEIPVIGAHVLWAGANTGVVTDEFGIFVLPTGGNPFRYPISTH